MIISTAELSPSSTYHLLTQTVIPRPIAWVLSKNQSEDSYNLAPFSYFTAVASDPALLLLSIAAKDKENTPKDSLINILNNTPFVIHLASSLQMQAVQDTATPLPYGDSELNLTQEQLVDFEGLPLKRLQQAPIAFACKHYAHQTIGNQPQHLVFAEVTHCYVADTAFSSDGKKITIDPNEINPLARLGLGQFCDIEHIRRAIP